MIKKTIAYQKLISSMQGLSNQKVVKMVVFWILFYFLLIINGVFGFRYSLMTYLCLAMFIFGTYQIGNARKSLTRNLPVSDRFVVINCMIVMPIWYMGLVFLSFALFGVVTMFASNLHEGMGIFEIAFTELLGLNKSFNLWGSILGALFIITVWFVFCAAIFSRRKMMKILFGVTTIAIYAGIEISTIIHARKIGYYGNLKFSDIVDFFPKYLPVIVMAIVTVAVGILSYKYCLRAYRYDVKGQRLEYYDETKLINQYNTTIKNNLKGGENHNKRTSLTILILVGTIAIVVMMFKALGILSSKDESRSFEEKTTSVEKYDNWNKKTDFDEIYFYASSSTFVFPEEVAKENVTLYKAGKIGRQKNGLDDVKMYRVLEQKLSKEQFEAEKERLAGIVCESNSDEFGQKVNHILHDTEHFSHEAYISRYDEGVKYEYAVLDQQNLKITYLFYYGTNPYSEFKGLDVFPKWYEEVISIEDANTDLKGYNIKSFYNVKEGFYDIIDGDEE